MSKNPLYSCIGCGHCEAIYKNEAIFVTGRTLKENDFFELKNDNIADFEQLHNLIKSRRSVRDFKDKEIPQNFIDKIIDTSSFAPMGISPSEVKLLVLQGIFIIYGYPKFKYKKGIKRSFAKVDFWKNRLTSHRKKTSFSSKITTKQY